MNNQQYFKKVSAVPMKRGDPNGRWKQIIKDFLESGMHIVQFDYKAYGKTARQAYCGLGMAIRRCYKDQGISVLWRGGNIYLVNESVGTK